MSAANLPVFDPLPARLHQEWTSVRAARSARVTAGTFGILGLLATLGATIVWPDSWLPLLMLLGSLPAMATVYGIARLLLGGRTVRAESFEAYAGTNDDARAAILLPTVAISLLAMPTLVIGATCLAAWVLNERVDGAAEMLFAYGSFMAVSHLVLLNACRKFSTDLSQPFGAQVDAKARGWSALKATTVGACIPGIVLMFLPPLATFALGLFIIPPLFRFFGRLHQRELKTLGEVESFCALQANEEAYVKALEVLRRTSARPSQRVGALRFLTQHFERSRFAPAIDAALKSEHPLTQRAGLAAAVDKRYRPNVEALAHLARHGDVATVDRIPALLARYRGSEEALVVLRRLLHHPDRQIRLSTVTSLGRTGTLKDVAGLLRCKERNLSEPELEGAVEEAVKRIQVRHAKGPAGALAVLEPEEDGRLSLPDDREGAISPIN